MEQRMPNPRTEPGRSADAGDRVLLVVPAEEASRGRDVITLSELLGALWLEKWLVLAILLSAVVLSVVYALFATQWYRAEVVLVPVKQRPGAIMESLGALGGLSSLASLAGFEFGREDTAEPIAVLQSRDFTGTFIEDQNLLPVLFAKKWDAAVGTWKGDDPKEWPDIRDGVRFFDKKIRQVDEDKAAGLVTLTIEWTDPVAAANWANLLVERVNARMRERDLREAERNISYLRRELSDSNIVTLQQSVGRLLESEMQKLMLARGSSEYAFRVVDRAETPKWRSWPKRLQVVILGSLFGALSAVLIVFLRHAGRRAS
jgi:uncharacterized protein involved in exopolysaccharide biosynthesis